MSIYKEVILGHYHSPHNHGKIAKPDAESSVSNSSCGDTITMTLKITDDTVEDIKFDGKGCAVSIAAASLLTDHVKGKSLKELQGLSAHDITQLLGIDLSPNRLKCALLPLEALTQALGSKESKK